MASSVPSPTIGPTGVVVPPQTGAGSILSGVLADMNAAFGGNLNIVNLSTPQGQLASSIAAYIADKNSLFSYFVSQVDPQYSQGFMQDGIARIFGLTRLPATYTTVTATCYGAVGTVIAANSQAQDTSGNLYTTQGGTIGGGGTVSLVFTAVTPGPVNCVSGTLTRIMTTTPGWDSITNPTGTDTNPSTLGVALESAAAFEQRRQKSLFVNAQSMTQSILAAVLASGAAIPSIPTDCYVIDNSTGSPLTTGGMTIPAYSVYVAVEGGDPTSIATAIWSKKSLGCGYAPSVGFTATLVTGSSSINVTAVSYGVIVVGQTIVDSHFGAPVTITALGTGTGGTGTYTVSAGADLGASGVSMTASTRVTVYDTSMTPPPAYAVSFTPAVHLPIYVAVSIVNSANLPAGVTALIQAAVAGAFLGEDGGPKARIGSVVYGARFYSAILAAVPQAQIINVQVGTTASPTGQSVATQINQYPVTSTGYITVTLV
jgi:hypothetical protein